MFDPSQLVYEIIRGRACAHAHYTTGGYVLNCGLSSGLFLFVLRHGDQYKDKNISLEA
jgi:hypothetical protein